jgi:hypothetical protein
MHDCLGRLPDEEYFAQAALAVSFSLLAMKAPFRLFAWIHCMPGLDVSVLGVFT